MWNSTKKETKRGRRYDIEDIPVLTYPLNPWLDLLEYEPVGNIVGQPMLARMEKEEFTYALFQVMHALLDDVPVPGEGHPGFQEAMVAELLEFTYEEIQVELDIGEPSGARRAAWNSFQRLCLHDIQWNPMPSLILHGLDLDLHDPQVYLSDQLTEDLWQEIVVGETGLFNEFLWDEDWTMDIFMDLPESQTAAARELIGLDLDRLHQLPPTPADAEYHMAKCYLKYVGWKAQAAAGRRYF